MLDFLNMWKINLSHQWISITLFNLGALNLSSSRNTCFWRVAKFKECCRASSQSSGQPRLAMILEINWLNNKGYTQEHTLLKHWSSNWELKNFGMNLVSFPFSWSLNLLLMNDLPLQVGNKANRSFTTVQASLFKPK